MNDKIFTIKLTDDEIEDLIIACAGIIQDNCINEIEEKPYYDLMNKLNLMKVGESKDDDKILKLLKENNDFIVGEKYGCIIIRCDIPHDDDNYHDVFALIDKNNDITYELDDTRDCYEETMSIDMDHLDKLRAFVELLKGGESKDD